MICFALEIRSFLLYRALPHQVRHNLADDVRLLRTAFRVVYAFAQLIVQILLSVDYMIGIVNLPGDLTLAIGALTVYPYLNTLLSLSSSTCLFVTR